MTEHLDPSEWEDLDRPDYEEDPSQKRREEVLASLYKTVPELAKAVKEDSGDTTTLWALACLARLAASDHAMEFGYQIALVSDVLRQRLMSGVIGDATSTKEYANHIHPPSFLRKVQLYLNADQAKKLKAKLAEHQIMYDSKKDRYWGWSTPTRVQFIESVIKEYSINQPEIEYE
tara:strand:+ start:701 stop:1225 length:525 start_codon:yes stop_codon:yes gene_type:complete